MGTMPEILKYSICCHPVLLVLPPLRSGTKEAFRLPNKIPFGGNDLAWEHHSVTEFFTQKLPGSFSSVYVLFGKSPSGIIDTLSSMDPRPSSFLCSYYFCPPHLSSYTFVNKVNITNIHIFSVLSVPKETKFK